MFIGCPSSAFFCMSTSSSCASFRELCDLLLRHSWARASSRFPFFENFLESTYFFVCILLTTSPFSYSFMALPLREIGHQCFRRLDQHRRRYHALDSKHERAPTNEAREKVVILR